MSALTPTAVAPRRNTRADAIERGGRRFFRCVAPGCTREIRWAGTGRIPQLCPEEHRRLSHALLSKPDAPATVDGAALMELLETPGVATLRFPGSGRVVTPWGEFVRDEMGEALEAAVLARPPRTHEEGSHG